MDGHPVTTSYCHIYYGFTSSSSLGFSYRQDVRLLQFLALIFEFFVLVVFLTVYVILYYKKTFRWTIFFYEQNKT